MTELAVVTDDGVRLATHFDGPTNAPALLFLNSLGTNLHMWDAQVAAPAERLRIVRFDARGHGKSDVPPGPYNIERLGRDALNVLDRFQIERAHVCGLSLGGMAALWIAAHHPARVDRAIFANTAARIGNVQSWNDRISVVERGGIEAVVPLVTRRFLSARFRQHNREATRFVSEMVAQNPAAGYIASCAAIRDCDLHDVVRKVSASSLVIGSELDEATPLAQSQELHELIPESELAVISQAGHLSNIEQPEAFTATLVRFLAHSPSGES